MLLYRIVSERQYAALNGKGAASVSTNRWNSLNTEVIYTSQSLELCYAEATRFVPISLLPDPHLMVIEIDTKPYKLTRYPTGWDQIPPGDQTQAMGDQFVNDQKHLAMAVQSIKFESSNILLNPNHPDFESKVRVVSIEPIVS